LVRRWLGRHGFDAAERWCRFNNQPPAVAVRALRAVPFEELLARIQTEDPAATRSPLVEDAVRLSPGALSRLSPALRGEIHVQDEGSQLVARFTEVRPGERVLDVCASPGGKSLVMAADLELDGAPSRSLLVAGDRRAGRVSLLAATFRQAGRRIPIVTLDARRPLPFRPAFDCVLLDAPCSGLGTLSRDPDLKWIRHEADLTRLAAGQGQMLASAARVLRPGGRLIYATCSPEPEETADVVDRFLAAHGQFVLAPPAGPRLPAGLTTARGCLETLPFRHGLDAFFAARLVRTGAP
jgi:16S rRNA (cytosine967-C5)-methyltransferase